MSATSTDGVELLLDVGLELRVADFADLLVRESRGEWIPWQLKVSQHSPSPTQIRQALGRLEASEAPGRILFVVPRAGAALIELARRDSRVAYAAINDQEVSFDGRHLSAARPKLQQTDSGKRTSWARWAILRQLAMNAVGLTQSEIARRIGVSHVAVRKQLPSLEPLIEKTRIGWRARDRGQCWDAFIAGYPGTGGVTTYWTAAVELHEQYALVGNAVKASHHAFSGDMAADLYAAWRRPAQLVVYTTEQPDLSKNGFAQAPRQDASVELRSPKDPTVLAMALPTKSAMLTDPAITAYDLSDRTTGDRDDAILRLKHYALNRITWPR